MHKLIPDVNVRCLQLIYILIFISLTSANVEKTIFIAPVPSTVPAENSAIDDLGLDRLSPTDYMLRTSLNASFPTADETLGSESWLYLEDLDPGQRYEVRICWLATVSHPLFGPCMSRKMLVTNKKNQKQPTSFSLTTYLLQEVVSDQNLLSAVLKYSDARLAGTSPPSSSRPSGDRENYPLNDDTGSGSFLHLHPPKARHQDNSRRRRSRSNLEKSTDPLALTSHAESVLFLRIHAAADYFTTNETLMNNVPPVIADIILDPFLWNVFPRSLVPTALYTVVIAVIAYFVGGYLAKALAELATSAVGKKDSDNNDAAPAKVENKKKR